MNIIFNFINQALSLLYHFTGDYGISIILITVIVKLLLMPMSIKQKQSMNKQQELSEKLSQIKEKYKDDKEKADEESKRFYKESTQGMLGCLLPFIQLPIIYSLYRVIIKIPVVTGTVLVPWVNSIKLPDPYFVLPVIYLVVTMIPLIMPYLPMIKATYKSKTSISNMIMVAIFSCMIIIKAPIAIGLYFIISSFYSAVEEFIYRIHMKSRLS